MQADASQVAIPLYTFDQSPLDEGSNWFYGTLPREAVCTENLTPWLKLLPCQGRQGLTQLMDRPTLYGASFHAMKVHLIVHGQSQNNTCHADSAMSGSCPSDRSDGLAGSQQCRQGSYLKHPTSAAATLTQTLTLVLRPEQLHTDDQTRASFSQLGKRVHPDLDLQRLFTVPGVGACSKADHTYLLFHFSKSLLAHTMPSNNKTELHAVSNQLYSIAPTPDAVISSPSGAFALWNVTAHQQAGQHDSQNGQCLQPSLSWHQQPEKWEAQTPPVQVAWSCYHAMRHTLKLTVAAFVEHTCSNLYSQDTSAFNPCCWLFQLCSVLSANFQLR